MRLHADMVVERGSLLLDIGLDVAAGETAVLLGPNGAGKTTVLHCIAGLVALDAGRIAMGDRIFDDGTGRVRLAPSERNVGVVFQDYLLFPDLDVTENVAFGLRSRGVAATEARRVALGWLDRMNLGPTARMSPGDLSGGQAQRVALARALATNPDVLLLDEPLAALDVATRQEVRRYLRRFLAEFDGPRILVTHDPVEAMVLGDRLVIIEGGKVTQDGTPSHVGRHPRSAYVASLVGLNLLRGAGDGRNVRLVGGGEISAADTVPAGDVFVVVRPQSVALYETPPAGTPRNVWASTVIGLDGERDRVRVELDGPVPIVAEVTPSAVADLHLEIGSRVYAVVKATDVTVYPD